jgi:hypothetical protein
LPLAKFPIHYRAGRIRGSSRIQALEAKIALPFGCVYSATTDQRLAKTLDDRVSTQHDFSII